MLKKINQMILEARKGGDRFKSKALSMVKAELINNDKSKKPLKEMHVLLGYAKRLEKASHAFKKTDRYDDLVKEMKIVDELVPKGMPRDDAKLLVQEYFNSNPDAKQPGPAIKALKLIHGDHNGKVLVPEVMAYFGK